MSAQTSSGRRISYDEVQSLYQETEQYKQQYEVMSQQEELVRQTVFDLEDSLKSIREIHTRAVGESILMPLGPRLRIELQLTEATKNAALFLIGSRISQQVTLVEAEEKLTDKTKQARQVLASIQSQLQQLEVMISQRENFLRQLVPLNE